MGIDRSGRGESGDRQEWKGRGVGIDRREKGEEWG